MNSYSMVGWQWHFVVKKTTPDGKELYLMSVRNGAEIWSFNPRHARKYAYSTARKHIRNLLASDPDSKEAVNDAEN